MKIVAYDRQIFACQTHGGISRYFSDLAAEFVSGTDYIIKPRWGFRMHRNIYLRSIESNLIYIEPSISIPSRWMFCKSRTSSFKEADLVHSTFYHGQPYTLRKKKLVSTVFDMIPECYPPLLNRRVHGNKYEWLKASDMIVSISDHTTNQLLDIYPQFVDKVKRIHLSSSLQELQEMTLPGLGSRFWLFVGKRGGYKNFEMLLHALSRVKSCKPPLLLCFGGGNFTRREMKLIADLGLVELVETLPAIVTNDRLLKTLYIHAEALLVPSQNEGFSLPLVEALHCNTPVVASSNAVHLEVGERFCRFPGKDNSSTWAEFLRSIITNPLDRLDKVLGETSLEEYRSYYSIKRVCTEHQAVYTSVL